MLIKLRSLRQSVSQSFYALESAHPKFVCKANRKKQQVQQKLYKNSHNLLHTQP